MKLIIILILLSMLCISAYSQPYASGESGRFQSVSGDFAKNWISDFKSQNQISDENLKNGLWDWGGVPKGKKIVNGQPVDDANLSPLYNFTANWLGDLPMNAPVYLDGSSPYGYYGQTNGKFNEAPLTPMALSDDPWVLAQELDRPVAFNWNNYYAGTPP